LGLEFDEEDVPRRERPVEGESEDIGGEFKISNGYLTLKFLFQGS